MSYHYYPCLPSCIWYICIIYLAVRSIIVDVYAAKEIKRLRANLEEEIRRSHALALAFKRIEDQAQQLEQIAARALYGNNAS